MPRVETPAGLLLALCVALASPVAAVASDSDAGAAPGRVAILPLLDASGARPESRDDYREAALLAIEARCRAVALPLVTRDAVGTALGELRLSPADAEDRSKARLADLATRLGARFVVTGVIEEAACRGRFRGGFSDQRETGHGRVRLRVYDAAEARYVEEWEQSGAALARDEGFLVARSRRLRSRAVSEAIHDAMVRFLTHCPTALARGPRNDAAQTASASD